MDNLTVKYRKHSKAINNTDREFLVNPNYFKEEEFRKVYTYPYLPIDIRLSLRYKWLVSQLFRSNRMNRANRLSKFFYWLVILYLNPFQLFIRLKKRINLRLQDNEFYIA
jgi:hypothetical protein